MAAEVSRAKMAATQSIMRQTDLSEPDKRKRIQEVQSIARDGSLSDADKVMQLEAAASGNARKASAGGSSGGSTASSSSNSSNASDGPGGATQADVNKLKMSISKTLMRDTTLSQADKGQRIRDVQRVGSDSALSHDEKMAKMKAIAEGTAGSGSTVKEEKERPVSPSSSSSSASSSASAADVSKIKMAISQSLMRNTTLPQADKGQKIRQVQRIASDTSLTNVEKIQKMTEVAEGGSSDSNGKDSPPPPTEADVTASDVNKTKMAVTQSLMRNTALVQSEKSARIREAQKVAADSGLSNSEKVRKLEAIGEGKGDDSSPAASSTAASVPSAPEAPEDKKLAAAPAADDDDDDDDEPIGDVDLVAFKSEVIQGLIKSSSIVGEEKKTRIQAAYKIFLDKDLDDNQKIRGLRKIKDGKVVKAEIVGSVFGPQPSAETAAAAAAAPEDMPMPSVGAGSTASDRLQAKLRGGGATATAGGGAGVQSGSTAQQRLQAKLQQGRTGGAGGAAAPAAPGINTGSTANDRLRAKMSQGASGGAAAAPAAPGISMGSTANDRLRAKMSQGASGSATARAPAPVAPGITTGSTANDRLRAKMSQGASGGAPAAAPTPAAPGISMGSTANDRLRAKMSQGASGGAAAAAPAPAPTAPGISMGSTANDRLKAKMSQGASGAAAAAPPAPTAPGITTGSTAQDRLRAKMAQGAAGGAAGAAAAAAAPPAPSAPGVTVGSTAQDRLRAKMAQGASGGAAAAAAAPQAPTAPGITTGSTAQDRLRAKMAQGSSSGAAAAPQAPTAPGVTTGSTAQDRLRAKMAQGASGGAAATPQAPSAPGVTTGSTAQDRLRAKMAQGASGGAAAAPSAPGVNTGSTAQDRLRAKMAQGASGGAAAAPPVPGVNSGSTAQDRLRAKMAQGASGGAAAPAPAGPGVSTTANDRLKSKLQQGQKASSASVASSTQGSTSNDRLKAKLAGGAVAAGAAAATIAATASGPGAPSSGGTREEKLRDKLQSGDGSNRVIAAAAANQSGMPAPIAGSESAPEARLNEKVNAGRNSNVDSKLRQGQASEKSRAMAKGNSKGSVPSRSSKGSASNKLQQGRSKNKLQQGDKKGGSLSNRVANKMSSRRMGKKSGKKDKYDIDDLSITDSDSEISEGWLDGEILEADVGVDEGGALQATLALEEELKQAVDAGGIKTLEELEREELEQALKEEDERLRRYWKKFALCVVAIMVIIGLSAGLTRGLATQLTFQELGDICNYTNTLAPWIKSAEINDDADFMEMFFNDGTFTPVFRGFGTNVAMSYDGSRAIVGGRFGDVFHVFERDTEVNFTKADWNLLGDVIPRIHSHELDNYKEMEEPQADVAISGDGTVVAAGYPYYRTDEDGNGRFEKLGAVVVYKLSEDNTTWAPLGEPFYGEGPKDYLGQGLALNEDGTIVAFGEFRNSFRTGRVTVHKFDGTEWNMIGDIPGENRGEQFGGEVSLSRDGTIVAGSAMLAGDGAARVYKYDGGTEWTQMGSTLYPWEGYTVFGWPISLSGDGDRVAVSSASYDSGGDIEGGLDTGTVWIFEYDGRLEDWQILGSPINGTMGGDGLGWGLSLSGDGKTVAAGAPNSDTYILEGGLIQTYRYHCGEWMKMGKDIEGLKGDSWTGLTVSLSYNGEYLAAGSPYDYAGEIGANGYVRFYEAPFDFDYMNLRTDENGLALNDTFKLKEGTLPEGDVGNKILEAIKQKKETIFT